jgi:hypothetical protein
MAVMRFNELKNVALLAALFAVPLILAAGFLSEPPAENAQASVATMQSAQ